MQEASGVLGFSARLLTVAMLLTVVLGCPPNPAPVVEDPPDPSLLPGRYIAEAPGTVVLSGDGVEDGVASGRLRASYIVYPDDRVVLTHLAVDLNDVDLVVPFLWWEASREPLRCTTLSSLRTAVGELGDDGAISFGAKQVRLGGVSQPARKDAQTCAGERRVLVAENPTEVTLEHDPMGNSFGFSGSFQATYEGNAYSVTIDFAGTYVNRPPTVNLAHGTLEATDSELVDGCPDPKSVANIDRGLRLRLLSRSEDPDPHGFSESNLKFPRADLAREDWVRSKDGKFVFIGEGRRVDEVTFESNREHVLQLTVTDHSGSRARKVCEFFVAEG